MKQSYVFEAEVKVIRAEKWKIEVRADSEEEAKEIAQIQLDRDLPYYMRNRGAEYISSKIDHLVFVNGKEAR